MKRSLKRLSCSSYQNGENNAVERQQLREQLEQLSGAIDRIQASADEKQRLSKLIDEIERQLDDSVVEDEPQNLSDQVESLISAFEAEHPSVAGILNRIMLTLSSMGI